MRVPTQGVSVKHAPLRHLVLGFALVSFAVAACGEEQLIDGGDPLFPAPHCDKLRQCCGEIGSAGAGGSSASMCTPDLHNAQHQQGGDLLCKAAYELTYQQQCPRTMSGATGVGGAGFTVGAGGFGVGFGGFGIGGFGPVGAGGTGAKSCGPFTADAACNFCLEASCCSQATACGLDPNCVTLVGNHCQACDQSPCAEACASAPSLALYEAFTMCLHTAACDTCGI